MGADSCTIALEVGEHHITIHFKSDEQVRRLYVHPDNIVLTSSTRNWSSRSGAELKLHESKWQARASLQSLCNELKSDRSQWNSLSADEVLNMIHQRIGMSPTLWSRVKKVVSWFLGVAIKVGIAVAGHLGPPVAASLIGW